MDAEYLRNFFKQKKEWQIAAESRSHHFDYDIMRGSGF
jgi:hypothetical protein